MPMRKKKTRVRRKVAYSSAASGGAELNWGNAVKGKKKGKKKDFIDKELDRQIKKMGSKRMTKAKKG